MARKTRTAQQVARTRAELLDAAAEALARLGVHTATMGQLAKACDCTTPTLYTYFESKQAIVRAVIATVARESAALLSSPAPEGLTLRQHLQWLLMDMFRWADRRTAYIQVIGTPRLDGLQPAGSASETMPLALAAIIEAHRAELPPGTSSVEAAHVLWGMVHGYGLMRLGAHLADWPPERTARSITVRYAAAMALSGADFHPESNQPTSS